MDFSTSERLQYLPIEYAAFLIAVIFHEYAHGWMAHRWGDRTAEEQGRLTLNPIPHISPMGTVVLPIMGMLGLFIPFGWAKPVPIDPRRFRKMRLGLFSVALAGPGMNVILAFLSAGLLCAMVRWMPDQFYLAEPLQQMAKFSVEMNYALGIFNLLPIAPLDGGRVIESVLRGEALRSFEQISRYGGLALLAALFLFPNALSFLSTPIEICSNVTLYLVAHLFRIA